MAVNLAPEDRERRTGLLVAVLACSLVLHVVLMFSLSDCSFTSFSDDMRATHKWTRDLPVMQIDQVAGDPFAAAAEARGRPAAAPNAEDEYHRVERLSENAPSSVAPPRAPEETAKLNAPAVTDAPAPRQPPVQPHEKIAVVETPVVPDEAAALPRRVIPDVPRIKHAPDITPPIDLLSAPAPLAAAKMSVSESAPPLPPAPRLDTADLGMLGNLRRTNGGDAFALGEGALEANAAAKARRQAAAREETEKKDSEARVAAERAKASDAARPMPAVDETLVARAKEAVRALRDDVADGKQFEENVRTDLAWWIDPTRPQFKYFRVRVAVRPERSLPVVAKDVVYLLDVSGSIGNDRLRACRNFVKEHVRSLNPGDRFNIAKFTSRVDYLFNDWKKPDQGVIRTADAWLDGLVAHGNTDVFATLRSALALTRSPDRPLIALFITDGEATSGITRSAEIISRFSELNDGLFSIYMYGVKEKANAYLMDMIARGNRGGWARHDGVRFRAAAELPALAASFADPVLADISVTFAAASRAEAYPRRVTNLYRAQPIEIWGLCPANQQEIVFNVRGLNGRHVYENMFRLMFVPGAQLGPEAKTEWARRRLYAQVEDYTIHPSRQLLRDLQLFSKSYGVEIPYAEEIR